MKSWRRSPRSVASPCRKRCEVFTCAQRTMSGAFSAYLIRCRLFVDTSMGSLCGPASIYGPASPRRIPADSGRSPNRAQTISPLVPAIGNSATACCWLRVFASVTQVPRSLRFYRERTISMSCVSRTRHRGALSIKRLEGCGVAAGGGAGVMLVMRAEGLCILNGVDADQTAENQVRRPRK